MLALLLAPASLLPPSRAPRPPLLSPAALRRLSPPLLSLQPPPALNGRPLVQGDMLIHKDEESMAWWSAQAVEVEGDRVLLHYTGCDASWDTWVPVDPMRLAHMDPDSKQRTASAFQSEEFEASLDDEEVLAQIRKKRWEDNARWQLTVFARSKRSHAPVQPRLASAALPFPSLASPRLASLPSRPPPCPAFPSRALPSLSASPSPASSPRAPLSLPSSPIVFLWCSSLSPHSTLSIPSLPHFPSPSNCSHLLDSPAVGHVPFPFLSPTLLCHLLPYARHPSQ